MLDDHLDVVDVNLKNVQNTVSFCLFNAKRKEDKIQSINILCWGLGTHGSLKR